MYSRFAPQWILCKSNSCKPYILPEKATRKIAYTSKSELMKIITDLPKQLEAEEKKTEEPAATGGTKQSQEEPVQIVIELEEKHHTPYNLKE